MSDSIDRLNLLGPTVVGVVALGRLRESDGTTRTVDLIAYCSICGVYRKSSSVSVWLISKATTPSVCIKITRMVVEDARCLDCGRLPVSLEIHGDRGVAIVLEGETLITCARGW